RHGAEGKGEGADGEEHESDVRVITRAAYRINGRGFLDPARPAHLWTVAPGEGAEKPAPRQVTSGEFEETSPALSPDGGRLFFVSTPAQEPYDSATDADLHAVPVAGGTPARVASIEGQIGEFALSADGRRVAFQAVPRITPPRSYDQPELYVAELEGGAAPR